jgi:hypothetical protein
MSRFGGSPSGDHLGACPRIVAGKFSVEQTLSSWRKVLRNMWFLRRKGNYQGGSSSISGGVKDLKKAPKSRRRVCSVPYRREG